MDSNVSVENKVNKNEKPNMDNKGMNSGNDGSGTGNGVKTTFLEKLGYGVASLGDATMYGFYGVFLMFFLTTIAGISPAVAGTIAAVGSVWNATFNPIMGYLADKVHTKMGRRRPIMLAFCLPIVISMFLLFTNVDMPMSIKPVYYGFLVMLYWTSYTGFFVPYLTLGADYTSDYDDRTVLRLFGSFFNMVGTMVSMVMPTMIVDFFGKLGMTESSAWSMTGLLLGVITAATVLLTVIASKRKDPPCEISLEIKAEDEKYCSEAAQVRNREYVTGATHIKHSKAHKGFLNEIPKLFKEYISVAKIKPVKYLIAASLFSLIGYAMIMSNLVYLFTYNKGFTSVEISGLMLLRAVLGTLFIPITGKLILLTDKRETLIGAYVIGAAGMCMIKFGLIPEAIETFMYMFFATICTAIYWQVMPGMFYDIAEYDKVTTGHQRTATIVSFLGLVEALAVGIGGQILGLVLENAGFEGQASVQTENAMIWIENAGTVIPQIFLLIAIVALCKYPINKKMYNELINNDCTSNIE